MGLIKLKCPANLSSENAIAFQREIALCHNDADEYELDFSDLSEITPFGMLVVGSAIRHKRVCCPDSKHTMKGHTTKKRDAKSLAAFLGFFESFGAPVPGQAEGGNSYLPIQCLDVQQLLQGDKYSKISVVKKIIAESERLANVLCQGHSADINKPVAYALRKIMRNCLEHGATHQFWYAAQYRPSRNRIEIAVLDEGRGVAESLRRNESLNVPDDTAALRLALQAGISGAETNKARSIDELHLAESEYGHDPSYYDNSGYGLYILSELCKRNGNLLILSRERSLRISHDGESIREAMHYGTAVRVVLHPDDIKDQFDSIINSVQQDALSKSSRLSVSMLDRYR